ncbi:MAG: M28 family peptidase [Dehalococcoidia bacterium]|nr:M28 family peptidase [Dehalococcoidia bacterium]MCB9491450.1 M28 family peptidase [Dehalococcoidia bacterium]
MPETPRVPRGLEPGVIEERIRAYESFGIHRTGWEGDDRTSTWLRDVLAEVGVDGELERFKFPRVEYRNARLTWPDGSISGTPMYDGGFTGYGGIEGELCEDSDPDPFGKIMIATSAVRGDKRWTAPMALKHYQELEEQGVVGVVVPSGDPEGEVILRNAEHIKTPFNLPVLQVSAKDARRLASSLVMGGVEGTLEVDGERLQSNATNVVATVAGSDESLAPIVVMTPKSGWFTCAAERGGGIAIWLALAEGVAALGPRRTVHFVASSGHELHHQGLSHYLAARFGLVKEAAAWLHLGASIGARYPQARLGGSDPYLHDLATGAVRDAGVDHETLEVFEVGNPGGGEARNIAEGGGRYVTFLGGHRYFHSPQDTVDVAVDAENVARWGQAAWTVLQGMLDLPEA